MATEIIMPKLGLPMTEGTIVRWLKQEGEPVEPGTPLLEIETDKVTLEVEAPAGGVLLKVLAQAGETVPLAQVIGYIGAPGEALPEMPARPEAVPAAQARPDPSSSPRRVSPVARRLAGEHELDLDQIEGSGSQGRIVEADIRRALAARPAEATSPEPPLLKASPIARRLAREHGLDLAAIEPTGPQDRIVEADIRRVLASHQAVETATALNPAAVPFQAVALTPVRRLTARRTTESFQSAPHFYLNVELVVVRLVELRARLLAEGEARLGLRLTYTDFLLRALALALPNHPLLNATWAGDQVRAYTEVHLGNAMATEQGLVVGVIHQAEALSLVELARARAGLVARAAAGQLAPEDVAGGTFTLTNLGMYGIDDFIPILNPPQSAILAAGAIVERPVGENGQVVVRPTLRLTLALDHRVADGVDGARFLQELRRLLEAPEQLLL